MTQTIPDTSRKWLVFAAVGSSYFISVAVATFSVLALPAISDDFAVPLRTVGWVVIVESLIVAGLLLPLGRLSDVVGRHRTLRAGVVVFGLGLVLSGLAPTFTLLIVARVVTSIGNTLVQAVGTGILVAAFPAEERGLAMGGQTTAVAIGAAVGPLLGGLLLDALDWQLLFLILAALTAVAFAIVHWALGPEPETTTTPTRFDSRGAALAALFILMLVLTVNDPFEFGWRSPVIPASAAVTIALLVAFVRVELAHSSPMLDVRLFSIGEFRRAVLIRLVAFTASTTIMLLTPIYLLGARGLNARTAGGLLALSAIGMMVGAQISGRLYDRVGPRLPITVGLTMQAFVLLALASVDEKSSVLLIAAATLTGGLGQGLWNVPANSVMMGAMPPDALGVGGAFTNVTRTVGNVVGQAGATAVVAGVMSSQGFAIPLGDIAETAGADVAFIDGWRLTFLIAIGITLVALAIGLRTGRTNDPAGGAPVDDRVT